MSLQTIVKAGNITNLSDARYCAGMGVEIIGFPVGKPGTLALEPSKIKEIIGWISGIKIALELNGTDFEEKVLLEMIEALRPDYLQIPYDQLSKIKKITSVPLILVTDLFSEISKEDLVLYSGNWALEKEKLTAYCSQHKVILSGSQISVSNVLETLKTLKPYAIELKGGAEISPGLKTFDELSEILELLEVDE